MQQRPVDPPAGRIGKTGYYHICFAAEEAEALVGRLRNNGVKVRAN